MLPLFYVLIKFSLIFLLQDVAKIGFEHRLIGMKTPLEFYINPLQTLNNICKHPKGWV